MNIREYESSDETEWVRTRLFSFLDCMRSDFMNINVNK